MKTTHNLYDTINFVYNFKSFCNKFLIATHLKNIYLLRFALFELLVQTFSYEVKNYFVNIFSIELPEPTPGFYNSFTHIFDNRKSSEMQTSQKNKALIM